MGYEDNGRSNRPSGGRRPNGMVEIWKAVAIGLGSLVIAMLSSAAMHYAAFFRDTVTREEIQPTVRKVADLCDRVSYMEGQVFAELEAIKHGIEQLNRKMEAPK